MKTILLALLFLFTSACATTPPNPEPVLWEYSVAVTNNVTALRQLGARGWEIIGFVPIQGPRGYHFMVMCKRRLGPQYPHVPFTMKRRTTIPDALR